MHYILFLEFRFFLILREKNEIKKQWEHKLKEKETARLLNKKNEIEINKVKESIDIKQYKSWKSMKNCQNTINISNCDFTKITKIYR